MPEPRRVFVGIVLALIVVGCQSPREPLRVGLPVWPPYDLAFLAEQEGYFHGYAIEFVEFQAPSEAVRSYRHNLIDAVFLTTQFALANIESMSDTRILYALDFSYGADALLARAGIETPEQLAGKRIGLEAAPLGAYVLIRALGLSGLTLDDVEPVFVDTPDQLAAFQEGRIDAVAAYEPTRTKLLNAGANEIFNSRSIPLEIVDVLVAGRATIDEKGATLSALVQGMDRALSDFRADPDSVTKLMADRHEMTNQEFANAMNSVELIDLETNVALFSGEDKRLKQGLLRQYQVMKQGGLLRTIPDLDLLLEASVVQQAISIR